MLCKWKGQMRLASERYYWCKLTVRWGARWVPGRALVGVWSGSRRGGAAPGCSRWCLEFEGQGVLAATLPGAVRAPRCGRCWGCVWALSGGGPRGC